MLTKRELENVSAERRLRPTRIAGWFSLPRSRGFFPLDLGGFGRDDLPP
jgi:hypothetical protein